MKEPPELTHAHTVDCRAAWTPKPGASACWLNPAGVMLYPALYGAHWTVRYPDGQEAHRYTLDEALSAAERYA